MVETNELHVALTVEDFEAAVDFYGRVLGLELAARWTQPAGNVGVFSIPRASLGILDAEAAAGVDDFEAGRRVSGQVRLALGVADVADTYAAAVGPGARHMGEVKVATWGDRVGRVESPEGLQLTLFSQARARSPTGWSTSRR